MSAINEKREIGEDNELISYHVLLFTSVFY